MANSRWAGPACCACRNLLDVPALHEPFVHHRSPPAPPSSAGWNMMMAVPAKARVSHRYLAAPSSIAVCPSWPQACIFPGSWRRNPVPSARGWAARPCRRAGRSPCPSLLRPLITPTTPLLPMPVTTSSQPNALSLAATAPAVRCTWSRDLGVFVDVATPFGDLVLHGGNAVDDGHERSPCVAGREDWRRSSPYLDFLAGRQADRPRQVEGSRRNGPAGWGSWLAPDGLNGQFKSTTLCCRVNSLQHDVFPETDPVIDLAHRRARRFVGPRRPLAGSRV